MSDPLIVSHAEAGKIRVFSVELSDAELNQIQNPKSDMPPTGAALAALIGVDWIDADFAELFDVQDLDGLGLPNYLLQGAGAQTAEIETVRLKLAQIEGIVLIVYSRAFTDFEGMLTPTRAVEFVGMFSEDVPDVTFETLPSQSAREPAASKPQKTHPHLNVISAIVLLPVVCLLLGLAIWLVFL